MRFIYSLILFTAPMFLAAQADSGVYRILRTVQLDSVVKGVEMLTGIQEVDLNGSKHRIISRYKDETGNVIAQYWLTETLDEMGYIPVQQSFSAKGVNVYAVKTGSVYPDRAFMICGHYDATANLEHLATGADDNASGCAGVLEAARVLKDTTLAFTVIFAFWDEEEQGLFGSKAFSSVWDQDDIKIEGVINMDMIGNDTNNDMRVEIHTRNFANSEHLARLMKQYNDWYEIGLDVEIRNPGTTASDHASFWEQNISAVLLIEDAQDFSDYYHTFLDSAHYLNDSFLFRNTQLGIATLVHLASDTSFSISLKEISQNTIALYPNPANTFITAEIKAGTERVKIFNAQGRLVQENLLREGINRIDLHELPAGCYFLHFSGEAGIIKSKPVILVR